MNWLTNSSGVIPSPALRDLSPPSPLGPRVSHPGDAGARRPFSLPDHPTLRGDRLRERRGQTHDMHTIRESLLVCRLRLPVVSTECPEFVVVHQRRALGSWRRFAPRLFSR